MTTVKRRKSPESYSPKGKPVIASLAERLYKEPWQETFVEKVSDLCTIVFRPETYVVGIGVPVSFESQGYGLANSFKSDTMNDYFLAKKLIPDGTVALLAQALHMDLADTEIISVRYDIHRDGNYRVILGIRVDSLGNLPEFLPENTVTLTVPACRYARMIINETKAEGRTGYAERMHADEYFIGAFRKDTGYVYDKGGYPLNTYDASGDILTKYEPVKLPTSEAEQFETFEFTPVLLPPMKIACSIQPPGDEDFVIFKYFKVQDQVYLTGLARLYGKDYYGFPVDVPGGYASCFGSRVSSFEGLPDCVEKITLPGGMYLHITQLEFNGDNPSMPYDAAFNHLDKLYFSSHPEYQWDESRKVIARFRQANCASVFVPLKRR